MTKREREYLRAAIVCFMGDDDGIDHWEHGMNLLQTINGSGDRRSTALALKCAERLRKTKVKK